MTHEIVARLVAQRLAIARRAYASVERNHNDEAAQAEYEAVLEACFWGVGDQINRLATTTPPTGNVEQVEYRGSVSPQAAKALRAAGLEYDADARVWRGELTPNDQQHVHRIAPHLRRTQS